MTQNFGLPLSITDYGTQVSGTINLVATGHDQASAFPLPTQEAVVTEVPVGAGVRLPAPFNYSITIYNEGAHSLLVYPAVGDRFFGLAINAPRSLDAGTSRVFVSFDTPLTVRPCVWYQQLPTGTGTVTSIDGSGGSTGLTLSGGPVTAVGTLTLGGVLNVASGGTGLGSGTSGGIPAYVTSGSLVSSAELIANRIVVGGGAGAAPHTIGSLGTPTEVLHGNTVGHAFFAALDLAADVTGRLPFANLGTLAAGRLFGNSGTVGADGSNIAVGANLTLAAGTLSAAAGGIPLTVSDGSASVSNVGSILVSGGTVTGSAGNATITATGGGGGVTSVVVDAAPFLNSGTITTTGTVSAATLAANSLIGNSAGSAAVPTAIAIGANLTLNSGTLSANAASGLVLQAQASLSSANILALSSVSATLVATPGPGFMIKPIASTIVYRHVTTPYTGGGNTNLFYGAGTTTAGSSFASAFLVGSNRVLLETVSTSGTFATAQVDDLPLVLQSPTAFAGGDGTAVLTVDYVVLPSS